MDNEQDATYGNDAAENGNRAMTRLYILPCMLTIGSLFCGILRSVSAAIKIHIVATADGFVIVKVIEIIEVVIVILRIERILLV